MHTLEIAPLTSELVSALKLLLPADGFWDSNGFVTSAAAGDGAGDGIEELLNELASELPVVELGVELCGGVLVDLTSKK